MIPEEPRVLAVLGRGLVDPASPVARADDAGLTRGDGCFEGCRVLDGGVAKLDRHLARLTRSAEALDIPVDIEAVAGLVHTAAGAWRAPGEAAMKVVVTRGPADGAPTVYVTVVALSPETARLRRAGLRIVTLDRGYPADAFADAPWLLGGVKTLSYAVNMAAQREAVRLGADDVILVSSDGIVLEGPTSSVVWAVGRTLATTPTGPTGILGGTTQDLLFENASAAGWDVTEACVTVAELQAADVVWLIGSVRGPIDVISLDGRDRRRRPELDAEIRRLADFG